MRAGFVGLGKMGGRMARRLVASGHDLVVFDVRAAAARELARAGATIAASPAEVAAQVPVVFGSLPSLQAVHAVTLGDNGIRAAGRPCTYVDLSTIGPGFARELAAELARARIAMVESPVTGGVQGAGSGRLSLLVSGPPRAIGAVLPMLECLGRVFRVGREPGQAQTMKMINNLLSASALAITAEGFVMGAKAGLDPELMLEVINASSGRNSATLDKFPQCVLNRRFDAGADVAILAKDVRLCLEEAARLDTSMWLGRCVEQIWEHLCRLGGARRDITEIVRFVEEWSGGVQVIAGGRRGAAAGRASRPAGAARRRRA